jgi:hypothetical protein
MLFRPHKWAIPTFLTNLNCVHSTGRCYLSTQNITFFKSFFMFELCFLYNINTIAIFCDNINIRVLNEFNYVERYSSEFDLFSCACWGWCLVLGGGGQSRQVSQAATWQQGPSWLLHLLQLYTPTTTSTHSRSNNIYGSPTACTTG